MCTSARQICAFVMFSDEVPRLLYPSSDLAMRMPKTSRFNVFTNSCGEPFFLDGFVNRHHNSLFPSFLLFKLRGFELLPHGTLTHCSCQPSLDAHFPVLIQPDFLEGRSRQYTTRRLYAHVDTFQDAGQMDDGCGPAVRDSWPSLRALNSTVTSEKVVVEIRA
jgi:hypothetical protein